MTFKGKGTLQKDDIRIDFVDGSFETDNEREIALLIDNGYNPVIKINKETGKWQNSKVQAKSGKPKSSS